MSSYSISTLTENILKDIGNANGCAETHSIQIKNLMEKINPLFSKLKEDEEMIYEKMKSLNKFNRDSEENLKQLKSQETIVVSLYREIEEINSHMLKDLKDNMVKIKDNNIQLKDIKSLRVKSIEMKEAYEKNMNIQRDLKDKATTLKVEYDKSTELNLKITEENEKLQNEITTQEEEITKIKNIITLVMEEIDKLKSEQSSSKTILEKLSKKLKNSVDANTLLKEQYTGLVKDANEYKVYTDIDDKSQLLLCMKTQLDDYEIRIEEKKNEIDQLNENNKQMHSEYKEMKNTITENEKTIAEVKQLINESQEKKNQIVLHTKELQDSIITHQELLLTSEKLSQNILHLQEKVETVGSGLISNLTKLKEDVQDDKTVVLEMEGRFNTSHSKIWQTFIEVKKIEEETQQELAKLEEEKQEYYTQKEKLMDQQQQIMTNVDNDLIVTIDKIKEESDMNEEKLKELCEKIKEQEVTISTLRSENEEKEQLETSGEILNKQKRNELVRKNKKNREKEKLKVEEALKSLSDIIAEGKKMLKLKSFKKDIDKIIEYKNYLNEVLIQNKTTSTD